jgi:hypothetical protein
MISSYARLKTIGGVFKSYIVSGSIDAKKADSMERK